MARYLVCSGRNSFPGITAWTMTHAVPSTQTVLTKDTCKALMDKSGCTTILLVKYFKERDPGSKMPLGNFAYDVTWAAPNPYVRQSCATLRLHQRWDGLARITKYSILIP